MRVTVRLFARLREIVGAPEVERDVPEEATLGIVWDRLAAEFQAQQRVPVGDVVAFLPRVSGG